VVLETRQRDTENLVRFSRKLDQLPRNQQVVLKPRRPPRQLLELQVTLVTARLRSGLLGLKAPLAVGLQLLPPLSQVGAVEPLTTQQRRHFATASASVDFVQERDLLLTREPASLTAVVL